jgi:hypothetical protein
MSQAKKHDRSLKPINSLFDRYKQQLRPPQKVVVDEVIEVIEDLFTITLEPSRIEYKSYEKCIYLRVSGVLKSELLLRKDEILAHIRARLGVNQGPTDIR